MLKSILAIIVSYIALFILFMAIFTGCYFALGIERVFQPDSYEVSTLWVILTLVIAFLVTMFAGYLCAALSKNWRCCDGCRRSRATIIPSSYRPIWKSPPNCR